MQLADLTITAFCDPAGKPRARQALRRVRARTAVVTVGADSLGRIYVLDAWMARAQPAETIERLLWVGTTFTPLRIGIEANAMQEWAGTAVTMEMQRRGIRLPLCDVHQPTTVDKLWRIRHTLQPMLARGQLLLRDDQVELRKELADFPTGQTVDGVDALASAITLLPARTVAAVAPRDDAQALATYLRRVGWTEDAISRRLAQVRANAATLSRRPTTASL